jgi:uncharacterized cysteine cluster protein YcgN (CxxCxxCC family)
MKKRLSAKRKSELCLICGKCCMAMTFSGGEVDDEARDEIDYVEEQGRTEYYFTIPKRCDALQEIKTPTGATNYVCGVYETRPQMCRDYDGRMEGPQGVADCLWRLEDGAMPAAATNLVQLRAPSR